MRPRSALSRTLISTFVAVAPSFLASQTFQLLSGWPQVNGIVHCMALDEVNGRLYLGGDFTQVDGQTRERIAAIDIATGGLLSWAPVANNTVLAMAVRGDSLFIGGNFDQVNGQARTRLAAIDRTTGVASAWAPVVNATVLGLLTSANVLYVSGTFTSVEGQTRNRLAAFEDGLLNPWNPNAGSQVNQMAWNGNNILVAGVFPSVGGALRSNLAELDPVIGVASAWVANANASALALSSNGGRVFSGGQFSTVNSTPRQGTVEVGASDGSVQPWNCAMTGAVRAMAYDGDIVFAGGFFSTVNTAPHTHLAALDGSTGALLSTSPAVSATVNSLIVYEGRLYVAGAFTLVNGSTPRDRLAVFSYCTQVPWFADADGDGLGDAGNSAVACAAPEGFVDNDDDCNDANNSIGAATTWYFDGDEDGFGDPGAPVVACTPPPGHAEEGSDCDDTDPDIAVGNPCDDGDPYTVSDVQSGFPTCGCSGQKILVSAKVFLQGAYDPETGLMRDDLRAAGLLPLQEPYSALGYDLGGLPLAGGDIVDPSVFQVTGPDAIVDWMILELRNPVDLALALSTRCVLLQRDGDIVDLDGFSPVQFPTAYGNYNIAVLHRNHMGIVTDVINGEYFEVRSIDLTSPDIDLLGTAPRVLVDDILMLRAGDVSFNDDVIYVGLGNDRDPVLITIGGTVPTATAIGYHPSDVTLDGVVKYVGPGNDRDPILVTIGGSTPTAIRSNSYGRYTQ